MCKSSMAFVTAFTDDGIPPPALPPIRSRRSHTVPAGVATNLGIWALAPALIMSTCTLALPLTANAANTHKDCEIVSRSASNGKMDELLIQQAVDDAQQQAIDDSTADNDVLRSFTTSGVRVVSIEGRRYILGSNGDVPVYLSELYYSEYLHDPKQRVLCDFDVVISQPGSPTPQRITVRTALDALLHDAVAADSDPSVYALSQPGLDRVKLLLDPRLLHRSLPRVDKRSFGSPLTDAV